MKINKLIMSVLFILFVSFNAQIVFSYDLGLLRKHGINSIPIALIQGDVEGKGKSILLVYEKKDKIFLSIIDNDGKKIDLEPSFSKKTNILELKIIDGKTKFILLKTKDDIWEVNNYWSVKDEEFFFVSKKLSSSKVYKSKNLKVESHQASLLNQSDDILMSDDHVYLKRRKLNEENIHFIESIEKYHGHIGYSGYSEGFYKKMGKQDSYLFSKIEFIRNDGFINDIFLSYELFLFPNSNKAVFNFDAGTAYRGEGAYFMLGLHLFKIEKSCGISSCSLIFEKNGEIVHTTELKNKYYN